MEKPTIYSSAPRPPKQIRVAENPAEPIVEKQDLPEKKEEQPSTITVMQPTVSKNNTVVKLNPEKQEPSDFPEEDTAVSVENEQPKNDEIIDASLQADLETATDFVENKQIVTIEEPNTATDADAKVDTEIAPKENEENVSVEEPKVAETETKTEDEPINVETAENEASLEVKTPETMDVDTEAAAESGIEPIEKDEDATVEIPEINDAEAKNENEKPAIEIKDSEAPIAAEQPEVVGVDKKSDKEDVSLITDEDVASIAPPPVEQDEKIEPSVETNTNTEAKIPVEPAVEAEVEFVTIAEQYSTNDVIEEVKAPTETKPSADKSSKSASSKQKAEAEYDFENLKIPGDDELFQRQYYTMGEVATMFHANQSQIRFWENEFDILQPKKNKKGDRYFRPEDVKNLQVIHHLLRNRRFTIEGAREYLKSNKQRTQDTVSAIASLNQLKSFLTELKANL